MDHSETISELTTALAKAQGAFASVQKSGQNPQLHNKYATLDDVITAIRKPLSDNGLAFIQPLTSNGAGFILETVLMHTSGEWLSCAAEMPIWAGNKAVNELQAFGGALTYMRRYMLASLLGVNSDEDADGNGKAKRNADRPEREPVQRPVQSATKPPEPAAPAAKGRLGDTPGAAAYVIRKARDKGLSDAEVHTALGVESTNDFEGDTKEALARIGQWVKEQNERPTESALDEVTKL